MVTIENLCEVVHIYMYKTKDKSKQKIKHIYYNKLLLCV